MKSLMALSRKKTITKWWIWGTLLQAHNKMMLEVYLMTTTEEGGGKWIQLLLRPIVKEDLCETEDVGRDQLECWVGRENSRFGSVRTMGFPSALTLTATSNCRGVKKQVSRRWFVVVVGEIVSDGLGNLLQHLTNHVKKQKTKKNFVIT